MRKTKGSPFFTTQFLKALHENNAISFSQAQGYWECNLVEATALSLTEDVVAFMAQQLQKLPELTQQSLKLAACVGNRFELSTLAIVSQQSMAETQAALWAALQEGLIVPHRELYKFRDKLHNQNKLASYKLASRELTSKKILSIAFYMIAFNKPPIR